MNQLVTTAKEPLSVVAYNAMCGAIAESDSLAECIDIADQAAALKEYARRIHNVEAERRAANVRLVAERRYGELLKVLARATPIEAGATGGRGNKALPAAGTALTPYARALADTGVSTQAASRYQALAEVPKATFDEAIRDPIASPTIRALINQVRDPQPQLSPGALWIWGRVSEFERNGVIDKDPLALLAEMTEPMQADMARIGPKMAAFLSRFAGDQS